MCDIDDRNKASSLLNALTFLSVQERLIDVVICTSDCSFLNRLEDIGYSSDHVSESFVLSDMTPVDVYGLLKHWKVRENLASALLNCYGGHVLQIHHALLELKLQHSEYTTSNAFLSGFSSHLDRFIRMCESKEALKLRVFPFLRQLAVEGFVPMKDRDALGKLAVECHVALHVSEMMSTNWIPNSLRHGAAGMIPILQSMRILIARELVRLGKN